MMPNSRAPRPTIDRAAPAPSSGTPRGSRDVGTIAATRTNAPATTGTFTKNTDPHQKCSSSQPVPTMPNEAPEAANPAHSAMARVRSCGGNTAVRMLSVPGMISAAPAPWTARRAMSIVALSAVVASSDMAPNRASPARSAPLRPNRSPMAPAVRTKPAKTRA
jgi:hypothetical protein